LGSIDVQTAEGDSRFSEVAVEFLGIDIPDYMGRDTELSDKFLDLNWTFSINQGETLYQNL